MIIVSLNVLLCIPQLHKQKEATKDTKENNIMGDSLPHDNSNQVQEINMIDQMNSLLRVMESKPHSIKNVDKALVESRECKNDVQDSMNEAINHFTS